MCDTGGGRILDNVSGTQQTSGMAGVEDTVKDFWATRPRRPRRGRKVAGVAAGIANRYRIDGPSREVLLELPFQRPGQEEMVMEIQFPVTKAA